MLFDAQYPNHSAENNNNKKQQSKDIKSKISHKQLADSLNRPFLAIVIPLAKGRHMSKVKSLLLYFFALQPLISTG